MSWSKLKGPLGTILLATGVSVNAAPVVYDFLYNPGGVTPNTWGTATIDFESDTSISFKFETKDPGNPTGAYVNHQATGFGFTFTGLTGAQHGSLLGVSNPADGAFAGDQDSLDWVKATNLNQIPNPANSNLSKSAFWFGATEPQSGGSGNFTPPGIEVGQMDIFYITGLSGLTSDNFAERIELVGVRLQSVDNNLNGGSLFLVGGPDGVTPPFEIPEPAPIALMGLAAMSALLLRRLRGK